MGPRLFAALVVFLLARAAVAGALQVAVISDLNGSYGSTDYDPRVAEAIERIIALKPALVISAGDMVAGQRRPPLSGAEVRAMWQGFHATVSDPLAAAGIPLVVTPGNHDASGYEGFEMERQIFAEKWADRQPDLEFRAGGHWPFHYAFDLDGVRFASLDATEVGRMDTGQQAWLADAMAGAGPTRILFSHLPLWPFTVGRETEVIGDPAVAALFSTLGITLHISGHPHAYYPGASDGIALVSMACLGAGPRALIGTDSPSEPGFAVLDISEGGKVVVREFEGDGFARTLDVTRLPPAIDTPVSHLTRLDLAGLPDVSTATTP